MAAADMPQPAIDVFTHYYRQVEDGITGFIAEDDISPLEHPDLLSDVSISAADATAALSATVMIKLNGGLGTSMGMAQAKSLLTVRAGRSFLDIIVDQVRHARSAYGVTLPLIFMNSFRTHDDTLAALAAYDDLAVDGLDLDFVQSQEPKLRADDLSPVKWPADPSLEWCPPGHGDLYTSLVSSGVLGPADLPRLPVRVGVQLRQPGCRSRCHARGLVRGQRGPVRGRGVPPDRRRPQRRSPGHPQGRRPVDPAGHRADGGGGDGLLHRRTPAPVLPHQQPVVRPAGAGPHPRRAQRRAGPAVDQERQDGRPRRPGVARGDPDRECDGRGGRGLRRGDGDRRRAGSGSCR